MVVELSWFQVEDVKNPHSGPSTASTTNSTFNYARDIAQEVAYSKERVPINTYFDDKMVGMEKALLTKSDCWSYEKEWRLIRYDKGPGVVEFRPQNLTGVIIGALASSTTVKNIKQWIQSRAMPIAIYRTSVNKKNFALDIQIEPTSLPEAR